MTQHPETNFMEPLLTTLDNLYERSYVMDLIHCTTNIGEAEYFEEELIGNYEGKD